MHDERKYKPTSGWFPLLFSMGLMLCAAVVFFTTIANNDRLNVFLLATLIVSSLIAFLVGFISLFGLMAIAPNQARVLLLFGAYKGSVVDSGFFWVNPFYTKTKLSLRIRNFETGATSKPERKDAAGQIVEHRTRSAGRPSKVNDREGNPIEISAVVVWKVVNTAEAMFEVDDYEDFVAVQSEAALRNLASRHPYDSEDHETSLRGNTQEISDQLRADIQARLDKAGVEVIESRISHLAYAAEIAAVMLQRQQAHAVVAARTKIVEGAVSMVQMALEQLSERQIVELDDERRATMVSNLLVVLCSDKHAQPVINTGSLY